MTRHAAVAVLATGLVALSIQPVNALNWRTPPPRFQTEAATIGTVVRSVEADGTLRAQEMVPVGSQVSGTVAQLHADFNSVVHRGEVLAALDPSLAKAALAEARANLAQAEADLLGARVARGDAKYQLDQAQTLRAKQEIPQADLETAQATFEQADANAKESEAQVKVAQSQVAQAEVDLRNTVILSPVDGVVVSREVQVGQTLTSSLEAPTLFQIATDLSRLQAIAVVDESDIGLVAAGQPVHFTVGAYPGEVFTGVVNQVRLNPITADGGVQYEVLIKAENPAMHLRPGMTPAVSIETARREHVLRVPNAALRFVPPREVFGELRQRAPADLEAIARAAKSQTAGGRGTVWALDGGRLKAVPVTVGISDGSYTEVSSTALQPGTVLVKGLVVKQ